MRIAASNICELTENIWRSLLGLDLRRTTRVFAAGEDEPVLTGCVQIAGAWEGAVTLDCSAKLARQVAGIMFGADPQITTKDEIRDALGELTHITGGNIKALLAGPCQVSLPSVTEGINYSLSIPRGHLVTQVAFECEGQPLLVTIFERDEERGRGKNL